jgi:hypothetical protein
MDQRIPIVEGYNLEGLDFGGQGRATAIGPVD